MFHKNTHFLVVDDYSTMRNIIKTVLRELGFNSFTEASNGKEALKVLETAATEGKPIEFIVSDWSMPELAGLDLLKACKQLENTKLIPFILVAAESEQKNILAAAQAGVSEYIVKPFTANTLKAKLERVWALELKKKSKAS